MYRPLALSLLVSAAGTGAVHAHEDPSPISYTFLEGRYFSADLDDFDDDLTGYGVNGKYAIGHNLHLVGGFASGSIDILGVDVDADAWEAGLGTHLSLNSTLDLQLEATYVDTEVAALGGSGSEDGFAADGLFRLAASPTLELNAGIRYEDVGDSDDTSYRLGTAVFLGSSTALTVGAAFGDDAESFFVGIRLQPSARH